MPGLMARGLATVAAPNVATPTPPAWARARIGQIATGATENRAALDRVRVRWLALKRDIAAETTRLGPTPPEEWSSFRREFLEQFAAWEAFYRDEYDNLAGDLWPISDLGAEIERWEATLTAYTSRFRALADREPSGVTSADTAPRAPLGPPSYDPIGDSIRWIALALIVLGVAWAIASGVSMVPRLPVRA